MISRSVLPGERIGAILSTESGKVRLLGFGEYVGNFPPPRDASLYLKAMACSGVPVPKLRLDDGQIVWDGECLWASEAAIKAIIDRMEITMVTIDSYRNPGRK